MILHSSYAGSDQELKGSESEFTYSALRSASQAWERAYSGRSRPGFDRKNATLDARKRLFTWDRACLRSEPAPERAERVGSEPKSRRRTAESGRLVRGD